MSFHAVPDAVRELKIPCGQCIGCRIDKSRAWAIRCTNEAQMHKRNAFITLTYAPEHLPERGSLQYRDFQLFMKRLRKELGPVRFFCVGEYGGQTNRPHYHALLFGQDFALDRKHWRNGKENMPVYISPTLARLWPLGNHEIGSVTFQSAAYCARYVLKKIGGEPADLHYRRLDPHTGELVQVEREFARMSLRPGIGRTWYDKYKNDVVNNDGIVLPGGNKVKPPAYYQRLLEQEPRWEEIEYERFVRSQKWVDDNTPERLAVREGVATAKAKQNPRNL